MFNSAFLPVIVGLSEKKNENMKERVHAVFQELGIKSTLQASRVGKISKQNRPVKVSLPDSNTVQQVLSQVMKLRQSANFSNVYVRPDRSEKERSQDRLLVQELFKKRESDPERLQFIRGRTIHTKDKPVE
jgi:hypothetical protein